MIGGEISGVETGRKVLGGGGGGTGLVWIRSDTGQKWDDSCNARKNISIRD